MGLCLAKRWINTICWHYKIITLSVHLYVSIYLCSKNVQYGWYVSEYEPALCGTSVTFAHWLACMNEHGQLLETKQRWVHLTVIWWLPLWPTSHTACHTSPGIIHRWMLLSTVQVGMYALYVDHFLRYLAGGFLYCVAWKWCSHAHTPSTPLCEFHGPIVHGHIHIHTFTIQTINEFEMCLEMMTKALCSYHTDSHALEKVRNIARMLQIRHSGCSKANWSL